MASNSSSVSSTATTPAALNAARYVSHAPARDPVCVPAARRPASARPPLRATTGFALARRRAAATNAAPSRIPSTKRPTTRVS